MKTIRFSKKLPPCLLSVLCLSATAQRVGMFDGHADIGTVTTKGAASYIPQNDEYIVSGAGTNIWGDRDEFQFVYKKMKGDFLLYAKADFVGWNGIEEHRKMGWMVRKNLDGKSAQVNAVVHGDGLTSLQFRKTDAAITEEVKSKITHADIGRVGKGISAQAPHGTVLESLPSHGSSHSVNKELST